MIDRIRLVVVCVNDADEAIDFYTEKLGFEKHVDHPYGDGLRWIEVQPPGSDTRVVLAPPGQHGDGKLGVRSNIIFATADIDATYDELTKRGVTFTEPATRPHHGPATAEFVDQDDNRFTLIERAT